MNTKIYKTEFGDEYLKPDDEQIKELMISQTRGCYQESAISRLYNEGYIIGYKATGSPIKGKAGNYQSKYQTSLRNVINRINKILPDGIEICSGSVGPKGAFGYYLEVY